MSNILRPGHPDAAYRKALEGVPDLRKVMLKVARDKAALEADRENAALYLELILEGLQPQSRLSKENQTEGFVYRDVMSDIMKR